MRRSLFSLLIIAVTGIIIYSNTLKAPFIWDDKLFILENAKIRDLSNFTDISGTRYLTFLSFAINYAINGYDVTGYHIFNIAVHILNAILVYLLIITLFKTPIFKVHNLSSPTAHSKEPAGYEPRPTSYIALFSALIFVSHPVYTQAINYTTQRSSLLTTFFYLLSIITYMKWRLDRQMQVVATRNRDAGYKTHDKKGIVHRASWPMYLGSLLSAVLAMKCKEISFTLPFVILLFDRCFFGRECGFKKSVVYAIPILLTLLIIPLDKPQPDVFASAQPGLFRIEDRNVLSGLNAKTLSIIPRKIYMLTELRVILTYIRLFFLPVNLNYAHDYSLSLSFLNSGISFSFLFIVSAIAFAVYLFTKAKKIGNGNSILISFGILWLFITLSIESIIVVLNFPIFEYRLYLPSIGIILSLAGLIGSVGAYLENKSRYIAAATVLIVILFSCATYARNNILKDEITLWKDMVRKASSFSRKAASHNNLGTVYAQQGRFDEAIGEYNAVLRLKPDSAEAHNNLANIYLKLGNIDNAITHYQAALGLNPNLAAAHRNLGLAYKQKGLVNEAMKEFQTALAINPDFLQAYRDMQSLGK